MTATVHQCTVSLGWLLVLLGTWRAPIPWLHTHEAADESGSLELAVHLADYHTGDEVAFGQWHWHFAMLQDVLSGDGCPVHGEEEESEEQTIILVPRQTISAVISLQLADRLISHAVCDMPLLRGATQTAWRGRSHLSHPLGWSSTFRSLLSLLCVLRC